MEVETVMEMETGVAMETEGEQLLNDQPGSTASEEQGLEMKGDEDLTLTVPSKKTKTMNADMRRVAEIVMVLSAMAGIRAGRGRDPTEAELKLMSEARSRLGEVCKDISPKDIVGKEAIGALIEDLGFNWKVKDQKLGFRGSSRLSIKERIVLASKKKAEEAKKLSVPATNYPSQITQSNTGQVISSHGPSSNVRVDKSSHMLSSAISSSPHLLTNSTGREASGTTFSRAERTQMKLEPSGTPVSSRSSQIQRPQTGQDYTRSDGTETVTGHMIQSAVPMQGVKYGQNSALMSNHSEIAKIVQKVLLPKLPECPSWTPPSRDYMNKPVTCQLCRHPVNEVETIVICDSCEKGFHLKCLEASNQKGIPRAEWHCAKCLSLSNGKPLPPKYGRVMRSLPPQKGTVNLPATQPQKAEGTGQKLNQEKIVNGPSTPSNSVVPVTIGTTTESQTVNPVKSVFENSSSANSLNESGTLAYPSFSTDLNPSISIASKDNINPLGGNNHVKTQTAADSNYSFSTPVADKNICEDVQPSPEISYKTEPSSGIEASHAEHDHSTDPSAVDNIISDQGNFGLSAHYPVQSSQNFESETPLQCSKSIPCAQIPKETSDVDLQNVEWVGTALRILDGKTYYQSCCIGGVTYEIYDYALICSRPNRLTPSRLQAMWEDNKTSFKWISVKQCYFPSDLPESINCPDAPEINEVYESNHEGSLMAGLIKGPCEVISSTKLIEKDEKGKVVAPLEMQSVFICRWFYDEVNRSFQPASS